uniref:NADH dehydrogenase subunit 2 n=1 Tax=Conlopa bredoni TaxID=3112144 RepID=UPI002E796301|nr:NADH dehydrogenase subunit 2 [Conlopa bredoni]WRK21427.1 NADH dehydrogenase subunit 2 [Conlopa bredoni]
MKLNFYNMLFLTMMILGMMISLSSNNLLMIWVGMEISFMCFMPMMSKSSKIMSHSSIKYYMVQSISSLIMILGMMLITSMMDLSISLISLSIMIKLALVPFHSWMILVIEQMDMWLILMLLILIKIPPINIASLIKSKMELICILSMSMSCIMTMNQTSMRKIIGYSSVFNMGMLMSTLNYNQTWIMFMMIYTMNLIIILTMMKKISMNFINQCLINEQNPQTKMNLSINLMSMGGMPPMMGFVMKMLIIEKLMEMKSIIMLLSISMFSVIMMFIYIRLSFLIIMFSSISMKWMMIKMDKMSMIFMLINMLTFPALMCTKTLY